MIKIEDIKVGSVLHIRKADLEDITGSAFIENIDPNDIYDSFNIKVVDIVGGWCEISFPKRNESIDVDTDKLAKVSVFANESANRKANRKADADRFKEITEKMSDTYKRKNHDYGNAFSEIYDELGINYGYGKIREKVNRIKTLKDNEAQVANEPLEDALLDCANYCILTLMEYQKRKEHGTD
nr:MAG TPA: Nucleotide modification associated domain 1 [Caudoviricetes sp.]